MSYSPTPHFWVTEEGEVEDTELCGYPHPNISSLPVCPTKPPSLLVSLEHPTVAPQPFCPSAPPYPMGWGRTGLQERVQLGRKAPCCLCDGFIMYSRFHPSPSLLRPIPWLFLIAAEHRIFVCIFLSVVQSFHSYVPTQVLDASSVLGDLLLFSMSIYSSILF